MKRPALRDRRSQAQCLLAIAGLLALAAAYAGGVFLATTVAADITPPLAGKTVRAQLLTISVAHALAVLLVASFAAWALIVLYRRSLFALGLLVAAPAAFALAWTVVQALLHDAPNKVFLAMQVQNFLLLLLAPAVLASIASWLLRCCGLQPSFAPPLGFVPSAADPLRG